MDKKVNKKSVRVNLSNDKKIELSLIESTLGPDVIDIRDLYKKSR